MWRTLSNEAREAVGRLCEQHGRHLYDYCRTGLSPSDAELAVAGALLSAHVHGERLRDRALLRPWLYALARCHRAGVAAARPGSIGSWKRPGAPDLVADALRALDPPHRELLDLSVRHELASAEIAAIFDVEAIQVNTMIAQAADRLEEWVAAVRAARTRDGCARLAIRMTDWAKAPGRRNRTRIARHIRSCPACQAAPRDTARAGLLLLDLPLTAVPDTLRDQPGWGDPLPSDPAAWRSDGFPAQARGLMEPPPALISLVPGPTTETRDNPWPAAGAAAAGQGAPPETESPGRARRVSSPPGTAEALLRAAHQTGERLLPTGLTPPDGSSGDTIPYRKSSGDTIPYRKRGDFLPLRPPPRRPDEPEPPAPRSAPPHWGTGPEPENEPATAEEPADAGREETPGPTTADQPGKETPGPRFAPPSWDETPNLRAKGGNAPYRPPRNDEESREQIRIPPPRQSDDPPRQHAPLRSLDPGWRSGRTPVSQYGDKLVFTAPPAEEGGETWDEFWRERPDEDNPEARISLQWLVRAALIVGVVMLVAGLVWAGIESRERQSPVPAPSAGPADPWTSPVPADSEGTGEANPENTGTTAETDDGDTSQADPGTFTRTDPGDKAASGAPEAAISPTSVRLGERRTGTFKLTCTGDCRVTSFSGSNGIALSGNTFTVRAPASRPGCDGPPVTESGVITVHWAGTATNDSGTAEAEGTLTMMVSWTVTSDKGALIPDADGGYWSNCPQARE
ncbi:hypothetical protein AB0J42_31555 [Nonomuraea sp. NPDC049649]|uniref:hypothetical protein n=1 Tax=Nonomuraea sp. NPDC049649 TaxID=3155776 RepID=UPI00341245E7